MFWFLATLLNLSVKHVCCWLYPPKKGISFVDFTFYTSAHLTYSSPITPEPCEEDEPEAEAGSPDIEPGTEQDQGLSNPEPVLTRFFIKVY